MRKLLLTIGLSIFGSQVAAAPLGMAEGESPFQVSRSSEVLRVEQSFPMLVDVEDRVTAGQSIVSIRTTDGEAIVVGKESTIAIPEPGRVELISGDMLGSLLGSSTTRLQYKEVQIAPLPVDETVTGNATAVIKAYENEYLEVTSLGNVPLVLTDTGTGRELAIAQEDDVILLTQDASGEWVAASGGKTMVLQQQPMAIGGGISGGGGGAMAGGGGGGAGSSRIAAPAAAGIGGGGGGGAAATRSSRDNNKDDDDRLRNPYWDEYGFDNPGNGDCCCVCFCCPRPPSSPVAPPNPCPPSNRTNNT